MCNHTEIIRDLLRHFTHAHSPQDALLASGSMVRGHAEHNDPLPTETDPGGHGAQLVPVASACVPAPQGEQILDPGSATHPAGQLEQLCPGWHMQLYTVSRYL
jgi:hypothetical protein